jgi:hypothetical protein
MSTATALPVDQGAPTFLRPSLVRLTRVEVRKSVDTRSGRVLIGVTLLLSLLALGYLVARGDASLLTYRDFVQVGTYPVLVLLPVVGVLAMAAEWTQRTVLTTFTFTPRRMRVLGAKLLAVVGLGVVVIAVVDALAALALVLRVLLLGASPSWTDTGSTLLGSMVSAGLGLVMGAALGALLMQPALAIATYFIAPNIVLLAVGVLASDKAEWVDIASAFGRLGRLDVSGHVWPTFSAVVAWIGLPLAVGVWRSLRRNVS